MDKPGSDTHHAVVAIASASPLAGAERFINTCCDVAWPWMADICSDVCSPRPVVHAAVIAAVGKPVASAGKKQQFHTTRKVQISQHRRSDSRRGEGGN